MHFNTVLLGLFKGSLQPFPSLSHFSVLLEHKLQQGGLFTLKAGGMRVSSRSMFQISSHHMKIPRRTHQSLNTETAVCAPTCGTLFISGRVWKCLIHDSDRQTSVSVMLMSCYYLMLQRNFSDFLRSDVRICATRGLWPVVTFQCYTFPPYP